LPPQALEWQDVCKPSIVIAEDKVKEASFQPAEVTEPATLMDNAASGSNGEVPCSGEWRPAAAFTAGQRVTLHGLITSDLNGQEGEVLSPGGQMLADGRRRVRLDSGREVAVRCEALAVTPSRRPARLATQHGRKQPLFVLVVGAVGLYYMFVIALWLCSRK